MSRAKFGTGTNEYSNIDISPGTIYNGPKSGHYSLVSKNRFENTHSIGQKYRFCGKLQW
jgi:hypothetical protein